MLSLRENAASIVRALREAGHVAYFAGGCVRDELLGLTPQDYDVATEATPDEVRAVGRAKKWRVNEVGASFGVLLALTPRESNETREVVEVATFREEGAYTDNRRPDEVRFSTASADARRRDFTINALFLDPLEARPDEPGAVVTAAPRGGWVVDFVGGCADVKGRLLRAVGDASARLREDHLRALRAVRLSSRLGFVIDGPTREAIAHDAAALRGVSRERIGDEVRRMLSHHSRGGAGALLQDLGLDAPTLEEPGARGALPTLGALAPTAGVATALAAWALDRHGPGVAPDDLAARWRRALCLSNDETGALRGALEGLALLGSEWEGWGVARRKRAASSGWFEGAMALLAARDPASARAIGHAVEDLSRTPGGLAPGAFVTGDDLVAMGRTPGPRFKALLDRLYDLQLEGKVRTREEALARAQDPEA